jgi:hypothetical protein
MAKNPTVKSSVCDPAEPEADAPGQKSITKAERRRSRPGLRLTGMPAGRQIDMRDLRQVIARTAKAPAAARF